MKALVVTLAAFISVSVFADSTASLTKKNGVQTLIVSGSNRPGDGSTGVLLELPNSFMNATNVLKVKRYPDASFYEGNYIRGHISCPIGRCTLSLTIEQKISTTPVPGRSTQLIEKLDKNTYEIMGDAAGEIFAALIDSGEKPKKGRKGPRGYKLYISGDSYTCSSTPAGGMVYSCMISINGNL